VDYRDFFDPKEENKAFRSGLDSTYAYLGWYDMFLEAAMERQEGKDEEKLRRELRKAAAILGNRVSLSMGKEASAADGLSIVNVAAEYGLYDFSFFCLLMALAQEMDGHYKSGHGMIRGAGNMSVPTFALAREVYSAGADEEQLLDSLKARNAIDNCPLFRITRSGDGEGSLFDSFEANRQLVSMLMGNYELPLSLKDICSENMGTDPKELTHHKKDLESLRIYLEKHGQTPVHDGRLSIIQIAGKKGSGRKQLCLAGIGDNSSCLVIDFSLLDKQSPSNYIETINELLVRARLLSEDMVVITDGESGRDSLKVFLQRCTGQLGRVFVLTDEKEELPDIALEMDIFRIEIGLPTVREQEETWKRSLSEHKVSDDVSAQQLSAKYRLSPGDIEECVRLASLTALSLGKRTVDNDDITAAVLKKTTSALDRLSDRIPLKFGWDDLVVEQSQKEIMEILVSRVKNRNMVDEQWGFDEKIPYGKGVSLILYGPPGTGKTMAAQVMAKEIGMALYRVDLSQMVDKYVGETEKNIGKIFDAAADGNVILFFDEADALFSKRTEVTSSNDKHANTEVAYLLQKIEQHDGITFLATNRFNDFDQAFVRRITYAVKMDKPDAQRRLKLFEGILPDKMPREKDLDLKYFAESFELSGSEIKEVIYSAAFIAAREDKPLSNRHLSRAIKYQQEKSGKVLHGAEFTRYLD